MFLEEKEGFDKEKLVSEINEVASKYGIVRDTVVKESSEKESSRCLKEPKEKKERVKKEPKEPKVKTIKPISKSEQVAKKKRKTVSNDFVVPEMGMDR